MEIVSGVISKEQHVMFKGKSIDEAVEFYFMSKYFLLKSTDLWRAENKEQKHMC